MQQLMTPAEAGDFLQIPSETLQRWRHFRTGPAWFKIGKHVRYDRAVLEEWVRTRQVTR